MCSLRAALVRKSGMLASFVRNTHGSKPKMAGLALDNQEEAARRRGSCEMDSFNVCRDLSTILIFGFLDFAIRLEIDHSPAIEFKGDLLKGKIDYPLYEYAIVAIMLDGCFPSEGLGSCRSLQ
jgi:hypothetical protein